MKKVKIGIVGCGSISGIYLKNLTSLYKEVEIAGVCDLIESRADYAVETYKLPKKYADMHELFADPEVDIVLNITRAYEHFDVSMAAIQAGKHVYTEKPLATTFEDGLKLVEAAKQKNVRIGGAPDTFLGAGIQTCRKMIEDGCIGKPLAATAFMTSNGMEGWHPDPEGFYKVGGGPMLDMGPYYVTALINLLGAVEYTAGISKIGFPERVMTSQAKFGGVIKVETPTNIMGVLQFASGVSASLYTSFDVQAAQLPIIEIYGSEGTLSVPDPNNFDGPIRLFRPENGSFLEVPIMLGYKENSRGLGLADMAKAIATNRPHRADSQQLLHALEVMTSFNKSSDAKAFVQMQSPFQKTAPMVNRKLAGILD